ncbi:MAG: helix-turn-helix domain-containing protein [Pseudonocardiaceae bacterium]|nr:helix-turn-helix domain-containing protein [Pseudonocardiaceae bacterium]
MTAPATDPVPKAVLARGLRLLDAFGPDDVELSLAELAARSGLPKPTALRLLGELTVWGALDRSESGYRLGMKLFLLGQRVARTRTLRDAALPYMEDLYEATHENVHLAVSDDSHTLFVEKVSGRESAPIESRVGGRLPAHCTATGRVFLAAGSDQDLRRVIDNGLRRCTPRTIVLPGLLRQELDRTLERGYGVNYEEVEVGVSAVGAPVFGKDGRVVAAISITGRTSRVTAERVAPAVVTAARGLSRELVAAGTH